MWVVCGYHTIVFINAQGEEGREKEGKCGWHVDCMLPCCLHQHWEEKKENMGSVWVVHHPIAVADAAGSPFLTPTIS